MEHRDLPPARHAEGTLRLPGSKSITNRALLLAALARGTTRLEALLESDDTRVMREALTALGVGLRALGGPENVEVQGVGGTRFPAKRAEIFLGNSGTSARSLTAALAFADGHYTLTGVPRMHERPIGDLVDALRMAGARIDYAGAQGFPPLAIAPHSGEWSAAEAGMKIRGDISSQFTSGLLMAIGATGKGATLEIEGELVSKPYVEITLASMAQFGVRVGREGWERLRIPAGSRYSSPGTVRVEGDASSASYFLAAGTLGGGPVRVEGVGRESAQGDVHFARVLEALGARVRFGDDWIEASGHPPFKPFDLDMNRIPDAAMTGAVLALFATGPSTLRNIGSWRVKETDRIAAMATELMKFGADVEAGRDFLRVTPPRNFLAPSFFNSAGASQPRRLSPVSVATYDDHRMAMCFSLASFGPLPVRILDPGCVSKTFPGYFDAFARIVR
jgi:3-phosphoshikimate 1-carboxyvinyltransferase